MAPASRVLAATRSRCTPPSPSAPTTTRCECAPGSSTRAATTASGSTSPCPRRRPPRRPSAPLRPSSAPRGGGPLGRVRPSHLPVPTLRDGGGPHGGPRGAPRVRAGRHRRGRRQARRTDPRPHTAALDRHAVTLGMSYRPFPAGPLTPVHGLQLVGEQIEANYALSVTPVDPTSSPTGCWCRLRWSPAWVAAGGPPSAPRSASRAPRSVPCAGTTACSRCGCSTPLPSPPRCASLRGAGGSWTCGAGRSRPSKAASPYAPSASPPPASRGVRPTESAHVAQPLPPAVTAPVAPSPVPSTTSPGRPHHQSCSVPRSFSVRGFSGWPLNSPLDSRSRS